jgi:hypothetical protein
VAARMVACLESAVQASCAWSMCSRLATAWLTRLCGPVFCYCAHCLHADAIPSCAIHTSSFSREMQHAPVQQDNRPQEASTASGKEHATRLRCCPWPPPMPQGPAPGQGARGGCHPVAPPPGLYHHRLQLHARGQDGTHAAAGGRGPSGRGQGQTWSVLLGAYSWLIVRGVLQAQHRPQQAHMAQHCRCFPAGY